MARKLSFSVESILSDEISTSVHKNDRMETAEAHPMQYYATRNNFQQQHHQIEHQHQHQHQQQQQQQPAQYGASGGNHHRSLSSSIVSMGVQRLPTPPTSPISVASAPSPITVSMMDDDDRNGSIIEVQSEGNDDLDTATPSPPGGGTGGQDSCCSKKGRMRFSQEQIQALEQRFQEQQYLLPADRKMLSVTLRMTERQIKTWFQNKRAQYKRARHMSSSTSVPHPGFMMAASPVPRPLSYHHPHSAKVGGAVGSITPLPTTPMSTHQATPHQYSQMAFRFPPIPSLVQPTIVPSTCLGGGAAIHPAAVTSPLPFTYNSTTDHKHFVLAPPLSPIVMGTSGGRMAASPLPMITRFPL